MSEILGPGGPLPAIPDDLTLVQFMLDYRHPSRPSVAQPEAWLVEDATGRRVFMDEVWSSHPLALSSENSASSPSP